MNLRGAQAISWFASSGIPTVRAGVPVPASTAAYTLAVMIDRARGQSVLSAVPHHEGQNSVPAGSLTREAINPHIGLRDYQARSLASGLNLPRELWHGFTRVAQSLYSVHWGLDAVVAEIDPLILTREGTWLALDGRLVVDDNALYRQPELSEAGETETRELIQTRAAGISYTRLNGQIGLMVNGAGLAATTLDLIAQYGGSRVRAANCFEIGGGAQAETVTTALRILFSDTTVRCVLINVFGGLTRCDEVAWGILRALDERPITLPMVVRLAGTHAGEGRAILHNAHLPHLISAATLTEAARLAVGAVEKS
jgi:succinyl-CoA synthetase beta subunit